jgi:hypothetical protein
VIVGAHNTRLSIDNYREIPKCASINSNLESINDKFSSLPMDVFVDGDDNEILLKQVDLLCPGTNILEICRHLNDALRNNGVQLNNKKHTLLALVAAVTFIFPCNGT